MSFALATVPSVPGLKTFGDISVQDNETGGSALLIDFTGSMTSGSSTASGNFAATATRSEQTRPHLQRSDIPAFLTTMDAAKQTEYAAYILREDNFHVFSFTSLGCFSTASARLLGAVALRMTSSGSPSDPSYARSLAYLKQALSVAINTGAVSAVRNFWLQAVRNSSRVSQQPYIPGESLGVWPEAVGAAAAIRNHDAPGLPPGFHAESFEDDYSQNG